MADMEVSLRWAGEGMVFESGEADGPRVIIDGARTRGISPMQALLLSICGCMGADIVDIAGKMRVTLGSLELIADADRAPEPPRYYTRLHLVVRVAADAADAPKLLRAIELSKETYCSVLHSLRPDVELTTELMLAEAP
jgi:putative redox protein